MLIDLLRGMLRKPSRPSDPGVRHASTYAGEQSRAFAHDAQPDDEPQDELEADRAIRQGRPQDAIVMLRRATGAEPENAEAHLALARAAGSLGFFGEAIHALRVARGLLPDRLDIVHNLGATHEAAGELLEAQRCYREAIDRRPDFFASHLNLGNVQRSLGDLSAARSSYEEALRLRPDSAKAHGNLANLFKQQGLLGPAEAHFRRASDLDPAEILWLFGIGATLHDLGRLDEAIAVYRTILERVPDDEKARHNLAYAYLEIGDFARGWSGSEIRFELAERAVKCHACSAPRWLGEPITDGALLVWGEQGVADEILFAGMYPELPRHAERIILECRAKLQPLFARSFPWASVVAKTEPVDERCIVDVRCQSAAGSLAAVLRPSIASFPSRRRYLVAEPLRAEYWREQLAALGPGLKIGLSWRSGRKSGERALADSRIEHWQALFRLPGVHWICLQYDDCKEELAWAQDQFGVALHRFDEVDFFDDLDEVAALNTGLDLVIARRSAVSLLSAALGVETWEFCFGADWQAHGTNGNPWLPAITRFKRAWDCTWEVFFEQLAERLSARLVP